MAKAKASKKGSSRQVTPGSIFESYSEDYSECRANEHVWKRQGATRNKPEGGIEVTEDGTLIITKRCPVCTTKRIDEIDPATGELIDRAYIHPPGYLLKGFSKGERPNKTEWRRGFYGALAKRLGR